MGARYTAADLLSCLHTAEPLLHVGWCAAEAELSREQKELSAKLAKWQQQIRRLVQTRDGSPTYPKPQQPEVENRTPPPVRLATGSLDAAASRLPARAASRTSASLCSVRASRNTWSTMQPFMTSNGNQHGRPSSPGDVSCQGRTLVARRCRQPDSNHAQSRRAQMRRRSQEAEQRRAQAKQQQKVQ